MDIGRQGCVCFSAYTTALNGWNVFFYDTGLVGKEEAAKEVRERAIYMSTPVLVVTPNRIGKTNQKNDLAPAYRIWASGALSDFLYVKRWCDSNS